MVLKFQFQTSILNLFIWSQSLTAWGETPISNIEQNHPLAGCHGYLQRILFHINLFYLTTGCTLTETVMWENYLWQQQFHCQEGKCKFLCIMIGSLSNSPCKKDSTTQQGMQKGASFCTTLLLLYQASDWLNQQNVPKLQVAVSICP